MEQTHSTDTGFLPNESSISAIVVPHSKMPSAETAQVDRAPQDIEKQPVDNATPDVARTGSTTSAAPIVTNEILLSPNEKLPKAQATVAPVGTVVRAIPVTPMPSLPEAEGANQDDMGSLADIIADMKSTHKNENEKRKQSKTLVIPKNVKKLDFLEGTWRCDRGMAVYHGGTNIKIDDAIYEFTFDRFGNASLYIKMKNVKTSYKGPARARLENGVLKIKHSDLPVYKKGSYDNAAGYTGGTIHCRQQGKDAICAIVAKDSGNNPHRGKFKFLRIK